MVKSNSYQIIADQIKEEVYAQSASKRTTVRMLLKKFGYKQRREEYAIFITNLLSEKGVIINPSIMKYGDKWELASDDRIYLSKKLVNTNTSIIEKISPQDNWNSDFWFDKIINKTYRTEREVETKFILPLLAKLGYNEDDRYDAMIVHAAQGSKQITLEVDFALFNSTSDCLKHQTLLVAEAKKELRLVKKIELENAQRQVKSYSLWLSCHFGLVTDSNKVQVLDLIPSFDGLKILFECDRSELKRRFHELYSIISKDALSIYYQKKMNLST